MPAVGGGSPGAEPAHRGVGPPGLIPLTGDAEALLYVLRDGLKREELRRERRRAGEYLGPSGAGQ